MGLRICLDPGHADTANKGVVNGYWESHMVFDLAYKLKDRLEKYKDVVVFVTKPVRNCNPDLEARGKVARDNNCEVFISLHSNAASAAACGVSIFRSVKRPDSVDLGKKLGQAVVNTMRPGTGITYFRNNGVPDTRLYPNTTDTDYYGVIRSSVKSDAVKYSYIIEHGFHTNVTECTWLYNSANVDKLADAEVAVLSEYFGLSLKDDQTPDPLPTPDPGKIEVGDIVDFLGGSHYSNANAETPASTNRTAGKAKVTSYYDGKHPYHLIGAQGGSGNDNSNVYGWVNTDQIKVDTPAQPSGPVKEGDIVYFTGGGVYSSANASTASYSIDAGEYRLMRIYQLGKVKHPYSINSKDGSRVYGWVDEDKIRSTSSDPVPTPTPDPEPDPEVCPYPEPSRQLTKGHSGDDVKWVQWYLVRDGYPVTIDGSFGSDTDTKVRQFQKDQGIKVDGWVGDDTKSRLKSPQSIKTNPYNEPTTTQSSGSKGEGVKWVQWELVESGYDIAIDGSFGPATNSAVRDFQSKVGISVDGKVGPDTRRKLKEYTGAPTSSDVSYKVGDKVIVNGAISNYGNGTGGTMQKNNATMYVSDIIDKNSYKNYIGVSVLKGSARQGWASPSMLRKA